MSDLPEDFSGQSPEAIAAQFLQLWRRPRRRARPRIAPALAEAEHVMVEGVAAWRLGEGAATLLVHGWEDDNSVWTPIADALCTYAEPLVAFDLPGHGFSQGETCELDAAADALLAVARALGPIRAVIAHSFGTPVVVEALERGALTVERCAFISPPISRLEQLKHRAPQRGMPPAVVDAIIAAYPARYGVPISHFDLRRIAPSMTVPALFVHSLDDDDCPAWLAQEAAALWPGAEMALTDGLGHRRITQDPSVIARIVDFVLGAPA